MDGLPLASSSSSASASPSCVFEAPRREGGEVDGRRRRSSRRPRRRRGDPRRSAGARLSLFRAAAAASSLIFAVVVCPFPSRFRRRPVRGVSSLIAVAEVVLPPLSRFRPPVVRGFSSPAGTRSSLLRPPRDDDDDGATMLREGGRAFVRRCDRTRRTAARHTPIPPSFASAASAAFAFDGGGGGGAAAAGGGPSPRSSGWASSSSSSSAFSARASVASSSSRPPPRRWLPPEGGPFAPPPPRTTTMPATTRPFSVAPRASNVAASADDDDDFDLDYPASRGEALLPSFEDDARDAPPPGRVGGALAKDHRGPDERRSKARGAGGGAARILANGAPSSSSSSSSSSPPSSFAAVAPSGPAVAAAAASPVARRTKRREEEEPTVESEGGTSSEIESFPPLRGGSSTTTTAGDVENRKDPSPPEELRSRPIPNGNWIPSDPLGWTKRFGSRSPSAFERLESLTKLRPGDDGYHDVSDVKVKNVSIVRTVRDAKIVVDKLMQADPTIWHACDTEVMDIDLKRVGPVGNGYVTCVSVYSGPAFDYGLGQGPGSALWIDNLDDAHGILQEFKGWFEDERFQKVWHNYGFDRHVLWNEGIDVQGFGGDTMHMARLQDTGRAKTAANNSGKNSNGSGGGGGGGGYSLEALTSDLLNRRKKPMKELFGVPRLRKDGSQGSLVDVPPVEVLQRDPRFRAKWILYSAYDAEGTYLVRERLRKLLETTPWMRGRNLMEYYDAYMRVFGEVLTDMERRGIRVDARDYLAEVEVRAREDRANHLREFRRWAASRIGPDGLALNPASSVQLQTFLFGGTKNKKTGERTETVRVFKVPREEIPEEALMAYEDRDNDVAASASSASAAVGRGGSTAPPPTDAQEAETDELDDMTVVQLKALCKDRKLKVSGRKAELRERLREHFLSPPPAKEEEERTTKTTADDFDSMSVPDLRDALVARGLSEKGKKSVLVKRLRDDTAFAAELMAAATSSSSSSDPPAAGEGRGNAGGGGGGGGGGPASDAYRTVSEALEAASIRTDGDALRDILEEVKKKNSIPSKFAEVTVTSVGMVPEKYTTGGAPSVTANVLKELAGEPTGEEPKYGKAYEFFGKGKAGHDACVALHNLCAIGSIDTMIANFLTSLQSSVDDDSRVHCSLNLNTETGRLSARRPNLQNQPALEKDKYRIRKAFRSGPGNNLIVADYGQLELRLLASMTGCESMIEAFEAGGDFHSRTALGMFDYIRRKVDDGECLLEWDYSKGDPPKPMLKDMFASERRKAKTLNFSIAYGKTAHGLSQDWGVSRAEAQEMLDAWYRSRPEVKRWQDETMAIARRDGLTRTLMGRYRQLPEAKGRDLGLVRHAERASINTPIQGGAADVAMMAMIKINQSELLRRLGWILLLQIHDEVILEGPEETAEEAFEEVVRCMEEPWVFGLERTKVPLLVDGSYTHKNWYDAK